MKGNTKLPIFKRFKPKKGCYFQKKTTRDGWFILLRLCVVFCFWFFFFRGDFFYRHFFWSGFFYGFFWSTICCGLFCRWLSFYCCFWFCRTSFFFGWHCNY